jgi:hypothetical protein
MLLSKASKAGQFETNQPYDHLDQTRATCLSTHRQTTVHSAQQLRRLTKHSSELAQTDRIPARTAEHHPP